MLAALAPTLAFPFGRDQATFAYMAQTILRGEMPYRDAWEVKPPGIYLLYSLVLAAAPQPGSEMLLVRLADCAVALGIAVLLARILAHLGRPEAGPAAALFYAALYLQGSYWSLAQAESWANLLVLMLVWIVLSPARKGQPLAVGLLLGGITGLKFTSLLPTLPFVWLTLRVREPGWPGRGGALLLGCIALPTALGGWLAVGGALPAYQEIQREFVVPYTRITWRGGTTALPLLVGATGVWLLRAWLPLTLAGLEACGGRGAGAGGARAEWTAWRLILGAGGLGLAGVWLQGKGFGYHWQPALPFLALGAGAGAVRLCHTLYSRARIPAGWAAGGTVLLGCLAVGIAAGSFHRDAVLVLLGRRPPATWWSRFGPPGRPDYSYLVDRAAAEWLRAHTLPEDPVLVWGFEPLLYLASDRRPPTRFLFTLPLTTPFAHPPWRAEFLGDLRRRPPRVVVVVHRDAVPLASGRQEDSAQQLEEWSELREWLRRGYEPAAWIEDLHLYRRKETLPRAGTP